MRGVRRSSGSAMVGLLGLIAALVVAVPTASADESTRAERLDGPDRYATAVQISKRAFPDGAQVVYLARADVFADALVAGSLDDGPVLLVPSKGASAAPTRLRRSPPRWSFRAGR